ncbi:MAG: bifunctional UDP-glucuronic acid oxidase/UDP-4-amino-4-deoxy-L-arabinose formyltransferase, partial [Proteobacteria bacterium]|nr:bifunctional UDP-glucuronic acid oxidase/UDP-4-amino-4-deoxy-L-arabinose formyltransferase [Pseudomonadota bacterium]
MRVVVLAYQEIGYVCLEALLQAGARVVAVLTHEDDPGEEVWFRSVAGLAGVRGLPVFTPSDPNAPEVLDRVRALEPDFIFSFYYRNLLGRPFLNLARRGAYNLHGSLLPKYRGRAPINWVLVQGESETGLTLHRMVERPDAGDVAARVRVPIAESDTVADLYRKMTVAAAGLVAETWPDLAAGRIVEAPQDESRATYFGRR